MKEVQNKNHTDEAKRLNEELDQNLKDLQPESKEAFQGFEVKEEKNEKKKKVKKKKTHCVPKRKMNLRAKNKCLYSLINCAGKLKPPAANWITAKDRIT